MCSEHDYRQAERFMRILLFDAYRDGRDSVIKSEVSKAIENEIEQLHAFNENLCKKDVSSIEKYICEHCEFRPSTDSEA